MSDFNQAIVIYDEQRAIDSVKSLANIVLALRTEVMKEDVDWGIIPGTGDKPTLLLPGMEKLMRALNAVPEYIERCVIRDYAAPLFHYEYECRLIDAHRGEPIPGGRGLGLCNSRESGFAWRWVEERLVPPGLDKSTLQKRGGKISEFTFAVEEAKTGGQYGKPVEYWQSFKDAIEKKTAVKITKTTSKGKAMDAWEIDSTVYRVPNPDIFDQVNSIIKRAKKRSLGDAVKGAAAISEHFTADLDDYTRYDDIDMVEGTFTEIPPEPVKIVNPPPPQEEPPSPPNPPAPPEVTGWATPDKIKTLMKHIHAAIPSIQGSEINRFANLKSLDDLDGWNKHANGQAAFDAIKSGWANAQKPAEPKKQQKPATTKSSHAWTDDEIGAMNAAAGRFYDPVLMQPLEPADALKLMQKAAWSEFGDPKVAVAALRTMCIEKVMPIIATKAVYMKGKYSELSNSILDVRKYGLGEELDAHGPEWAAYTETWEKGQTYTFMEDEMPNLIVHWKLDDSGVPVATEIKVLELAF